ncbi:tetratricopeptide repeat protein (plasmid) [Streptomyces sp. NBC_01007]|nr:tetratricopeptide repeat protein [Streptomyces sp. NBC_01007]
MAEKATAEGKAFAFMLREVLERLAARGLTQRKISDELGDGFSNSQLSRMACGAKIPTPEQLAKLLLLLEVEVGQRLPASARALVVEANLSALQAMQSPVLAMVTAQEEARQWQRHAEEAQAREAVAERDLGQARRTLDKLRLELRKAKAREVQLSRAAHERLTEMSALHENRADAAARELAVQRLVIAELEQSSETLAAKVEQLEGHVRRHQAELAEALRALEAETVRAAEAEHAAVEDRNRREQMGEEVSVLTDLLQQVQAELAELQREHAERLAHADVLAEAEAVVRRAQRAAQPQPTSHAGGGQGIDSRAESTGTPLPTDAEQVRRVGRRAPASEVAARLQVLLDEGDTDAVDVLLRAVAERSAQDIVAALDALAEVGCYRQREQLTRVCAAQSPSKVVALLLALRASDAASEAGWLIDEAARTPTGAVQEMVTLLLKHKERAFARRLLDEAAPRGSVTEIAELITLLEDVWSGEASRLVRDTVSRRRVNDAVALVPRLSSASVEIALAAIAARSLAVVSNALGLFTAADERTLSARLAEHTARRSTDDVAALAGLLDEQNREAEQDWLLNSYLQQRPAEVTDLLPALAKQRQGQGASAAAVMHKVGERGSVADVQKIVAYALQHDLSPEPILRGVACRHPEDVWSLLAVLSHGNLQVADSLVEQVMTNLPAAAVVDVVERCLESGLGTVDVAGAAARSAPDLEVALSLASTLRERGWTEDAAHLVRIAGQSDGYLPSAIADALKTELASWVLSPLLTGVSQRGPWECQAVIDTLRAQGMDGYVRLMLEHGPTPAHIPDLVGCLLESGMSEYAYSLHARLVRTASATDVASVLGTASRPTAAEIIALASTEPASYLAELVSCLAQRGCGYQILALLACVGRGSATRARDLAVLLSEAGRERQGAWLHRQAEQMRPRVGELPPAELFSEAIDAASQFYDDDDLEASFNVLNTAILTDNFSPTDIAAHLDADLLTFFLQEHLAEDTPFAHSLASTDPAEISVYLRKLNDRPLRRRLTERAIQHTSVSEVPALFTALHSHLDNTELDLAYQLLAKRPGTDLVVVSSALTEQDPSRTRRMLREALGTQPIEALSTLLPLARQNQVIVDRADLKALLTDRAQDHAAVNAIRYVFEPLYQSLADEPSGRRAVGYYLQDPSHTTASYWNGDAWTEDRLPLAGTAEAQTALSAHRAALSEAKAPHSKARESLRLAAALSFLKDADHEETLTARHTYLYWLHQSGHVNEAQQLIRQLVSDVSHVLGPDAKATLLVLFDQAQWAGEAGDPSRAARLFDDLAGDYIRIYGQDHAGALNAAACHAVWLAESGETQQSAPLLQKSIVRLSSVIDGHPRSGWALTRRGEAHHAVGNYDAAITDFTAAHKLTPDDRWVLAHRGESFRAAGRYDEAIRDLTTVRARNLANPWVLARRGEAHLDAGHYSSAISDFSAALKINPRDSSLLTLRGEAHRLAGQHAKAITDLTAALELDDKNAWALARRGEAQREIGHFNKALSDFTTALALTPDDAWAIGSRGEAHRQVGHYDEAIADLSAAIRLDGTLGWALEARAQAHRQAGRYEPSIADFTAALEVYPDDPWTHTQRGIIRRELGNYELARRDFEQAMLHSPSPDPPGLRFEMILLNTRAQGGFSVSQQLWRSLFDATVSTPESDATRFFDLFRVLLLEPRGDIAKAAHAFLAQKPDQDAITDLLNYLVEFSAVKEVASRAQQCSQIILLSASR